MWGQNTGLAPKPHKQPESLCQWEEAELQISSCCHPVKQPGFFSVQMEIALTFTTHGSIWSHCAQSPILHTVAEPGVFAGLLWPFGMSQTMSYHSEMLPRSLCSTSLSDPCLHMTQWILGCILFTVCNFTATTITLLAANNLVNIFTASWRSLA